MDGKQAIIGSNTEILLTYVFPEKSLNSESFNDGIGDTWYSYHDSVIHYDTRYDKSLYDIYADIPDFYSKNTNNHSYYFYEKNGRYARKIVDINTDNTFDVYIYLDFFEIGVNADFSFMISGSTEILEDFNYEFYCNRQEYCYAADSIVYTHIPFLRTAKKSSGNRKISSVIFFGSDFQDFICANAQGSAD